MKLLTILQIRIINLHKKFNLIYFRNSIIILLLYLETTNSQLKYRCQDDVFVLNLAWQHIYAHSLRIWRVLSLIAWAKFFGFWFLTQFPILKLHSSHLEENHLVWSAVSVRKSRKSLEISKFGQSSHIISGSTWARVYLLEG